MLKKIMATALSIVMLLMLCPVSFADGAEATRLFDDFSQFTEEITTTFANYPSGSGVTGVTSEVFNDKTYLTMYQIVDADPSEEVTNMAMKVVVPNANGTAPVNMLEMAENEITRYSFDFMINEMATVATESVTTNGLFSFGEAASGKTRFTIFPSKTNDGAVIYKLNYDWSNKCTVEQGKWYKMVFYLGSDLKTMSLYFIDAGTGDVLFSVSDYTHGSEIVLDAFNINKANFATVGGYFLLDNVELRKYALTDTPEMIEKTVSDGAQNVLRNTPLEFSFNQKISGSASLSKVTENGEEPVLVTQKIIPAFNKLILSYDGLLDRNAEYKLSFSGITSANGASSEEIIFKTEDLHLLNEVEVSGAVANSSKTDVSFTLSDPFGYSAFDGLVMAAVFEDGKMLKADIKNLTNALTKSELTVSFDLGTVPEGAEIQVMILDAAEKVVPIASGSFSK